MARRPRVGYEPVNWWIVALVGALAFALVPVPAWVVDQFYSREMYAWLQTWLTAATNLLPFAVLDVLIAGVVVVVVLRLGMLWNTLRSRSATDALWEGGRRLVRFLAVVAILFFWTWGCNYRRLPLETALTTQAATETSVDRLRVAVAESNALAVRTRASLRDADQSYDALARGLLGPMNRALAALDREPLGTAGRPKYSLFLTPFFTLAGVNGMHNPFALESIVHPELLPYERAFVLAHEWAHLAGHGDEAEASAIGWMACMNGSPVAAYSGSLFLIMEAAAALPPAARQAAIDQLDAGVRADLAAIARRTERQNPTVQRAAFRAYDEYLRANRVEDGTASYARSLTLILSPPIYDAMGEFTGRR